MARVLVLGGVGVDTIVRVPALPVPDTDVVHVPRIERHVGHSGSGWAVGFAAAGHDVTVVDLVGDDPEAQLCADHFGRRGVRFLPVVVPEGTKRSVNLVDPAGRRTSLHDGRGQESADTASLEHLLDAADHVHVVINTWTRPLLRAAVARGLLVSTDLHEWDGANPHHVEFAAAADVVVLSAANLADPPDVCRRIVASGRASLVACTAGASGVWLLGGGHEWTHVEAVTLPDRPVVDTNGAGDAFGSAFVASLLRGDDPLDAARRGVVAGAWACGAHGAASEAIGRDELEQRLLTLARGH